MKTKLIRLACFLTALLALTEVARAQGSAFTYQGRLMENGAPASGSNDFTFTLYDAASGGAAVGVSNVVNGLGVTNGLFTVALDFGAAAFSGSDRWLEIAVRPGTNAGAYTPLTPRQRITSAPYAIRAANLTGALPLAQLPAGVVTNNSSGVLLSGTFTGNGAALSNVNATTLGGLSSAGIWKTNGNAGANPTNGAFLGTTDNLPVEFRVNGERALRLEPIAQGVISFISAPNVLGGWAGNQVANGAIGATVWGGGFGFFEDYGNIVGADFGTVSGGRQNTAGGAEATVAGGRGNTASGGNATISGGYVNAAMGSHATVGGGLGNTAVGDTSTVSGGAQNTIQTNSPDTTIGGGANNTVSSNSWRGTVGGGFVNTVGAPEGTVAGGAFNSALGFSATVSGGGNNAASGGWSTIAGGRDNVLTNADYATIGGGVNNTVRSNSWRGTVGGGAVNTIGAPEGTVAGGAFNSALGFSATIGGGGGNSASGEWSTIAGGRDNLLNTAPYATIGGGVQNTIQSNGFAATIPGGWLNNAADFGFAAGRRAKANHTGAFVWADATDADFVSSGANQFLIRAAGGVGINNNNPNGAALAVHGNVTVNGVIGGNGAGLTNLNISRMGSGANGANLLQFNDTAGSQQVYLRAARNLDMETANNATFWVGYDFFATVDHDATVHVKHDADVTVDNNLSVATSGSTTLAVGNNLSASVGASLSLAVGNDLSVTAGNKLAVLAPGGVGLGTSNPQANLHVYGANNPTVVRVQSTGTPGFGRIEFVSDPQGSPSEWRPAYIQSTDNGGFAGGLSFHVNGTGFDNRFGDIEVMRVVNGAVGIGTPNPVSALHVVGTVTATAFNPPSDRNLKENFAPVNPREVLEKVAALPISRWNFKGDAATPHVGPMAQDFYEAFGTGTDERHIATVDADGVALAAIQGLNQKLEEKDARIAELERRLADIEALFQQ